MFPWCDVNFVSRNGAGGGQLYTLLVLPKYGLSEVMAFVIVNFCLCLHLADVFIGISTAAAPLIWLCLHRVREAAMTSLMEVTLLLVQNEAELINANMYVMCC